MSIGVVAAESLSHRGCHEVVIGGDECQASLPGSVQDRDCRESRCQLLWVVSAQPMSLRQFDREVEDGTRRRDEVVFGLTMAREKVNRIIAFDQREAASSVSSRDSGCDLNLRQL
jgi:hypothetical protein